MGKITRSSASGLHGGEAKEWWRGNRTDDIIALCQEYGFAYKQLTPYQLRVAGKVDFYTTNGRVHVLSLNRRYDYHTYLDAKQIFEQIKQGKV